MKNSNIIFFTILLQLLLFSPFYSNLFMILKTLKICCIFHEIVVIYQMNIFHKEAALMINKTMQVSECGSGMLTTYILDSESKRPAVLILPGGAYFFTSSREAEPIAMQFTAKGYHAFVLNYSVAPYRHPQPLLDVSNAMCIIRENAELWNIESDKIAVCGFSAGGTLPLR